MAGALFEAAIKLISEGRARKKLSVARETVLTPLGVIAVFTENQDDFKVVFEPRSIDFAPVVPRVLECVVFSGDASTS